MKKERESLSGNIWGWKFSIYGLVLILILMGLMIYRHISLGVPFGSPDKAVDSSEIISNQ